MKKKRTLTQKITSLFLTMALSLSLMPAAVFAEEHVHETESVSSVQEAVTDESPAGADAEIVSDSEAIDGHVHSDHEEEGYIHSDSEDESENNEIHDTADEISEETSDAEADQTVSETEEDNSEPETIVSREKYVDPFFSDGTEPEDLKTPRDRGTAIGTMDVDGSESTVYVSVDEAALKLREQMKAHKKSIKVNVFVEEYDDETTLAAELVEKAVAHTGTDNEGDYLRWSYPNWSSVKVANKTDDGWNVGVTIQFTYRSTAEQEEELNTQLASIMDELNLDGKSDYEKVKAVYDYVCSTVIYAYKTNSSGTAYELNSSGNRVLDNAALSYTAYRAVIEKTAVCLGFSGLVYRMLLQSGIDCRIITGSGNSSGSGNYHAWNIIKLNGKWYNADSTWDEVCWDSAYTSGSTTIPSKLSTQRTAYSNFLLNQANFKNHTRNEIYSTSAFMAQHPMSETDYSVDDSGSDSGSDEDSDEDDDSEIRSISADTTEFTLKKGETVLIKGVDAAVGTYDTDYVSVTAQAGTADTEKEFVSGTTYYVSDGKGNFLTYDEEYTLSSAKDISEAKKWRPYTFPDTGSTFLYTSDYKYVLNFGTSAEPVFELQTSTGSSINYGSSGIGGSSNTSFKIIFADGAWGASASGEGNPAFFFNAAVNASVTGLTEGDTTVTLGSREYTIHVTDAEHVHSYKPSWSWSDDYSSVVMTMICSEDSGHAEQISASVSQNSNGLTTVYTASAVYDGVTYKDYRETAKSSVSLTMYVGDTLTEKALGSVAGTGDDIVDVSTEASLIPSGVKADTLKHGRQYFLGTETGVFAGKGATETIVGTTAADAALFDITYFSRREGYYFTENTTDRYLYPSSSTGVFSLLYGTFFRLTDYGLQDVQTDNTLQFDGSTFITTSGLADAMVYPYPAVEGTAISFTAKKAGTTTINLGGVTYTVTVKEAAGQSTKNISLHVGDTYSLVSDLDYSSSGISAEHVIVSTVKGSVPSDDPVSAMTSGTRYYIGDGSGHYLGYTSAGAIETTDAAAAKTFSSVQASSGNFYFTASGKYLYSGSSGSVLASTYATGYNNVYYSYSSSGLVPELASSSFLRYNSSSDRWLISNRSAYAKAYVYPAVTGNKITITAASAGSTVLTLEGVTYNITVEDHTWGDRTVAAESTCTSYGVASYTCSECSVKKTEKIDALGHSYELVGWNWNDDFSSAEVNFTCSTDSSHTVKRTVSSVSETLEDGRTAYSAQTTLTGTVYSDTAYSLTIHAGEQFTLHTDKDTTDTENDYFTVSAQTTTTPVLVKSSELNTTDTYYISDGSNFMMVQDGAIGNTTDPEKASEWSLVLYSSLSKYFFRTAVDGITYRLAADTSVTPDALTLSTTNNGTVFGIDESDGNLIDFRNNRLVCTEGVWAFSQDAASGAAYQKTGENVAGTVTVTGKAAGTETVTICGSVYKITVEAGEEHTHIAVTDEAVEATCTETGLTEGSHCEVCGEVLVKQEVVASLGHTVVTDKAVEATCTETGLTEGSHCEVCGEVLTKQEVVAALGHTVETDKAVEATCTETGLTEGSHCEVCGEVLVEQEVVPALGHEYKADSAKWAEDYSTAVINLVCTHDAAHKVEVDASSVEKTVKDTKVIFTASAEYEGKTYTIETDASDHTHDYTGEVVKTATCTEEGLNRYTCSYCEDTYTETVPALGHVSVVDKTVEATCTETGLTEGSHCEVCGEVLTKQEVVAALGHTVVIDKAVEATCTTTGLTEGSHCEVCGEVLVKQEVVEALGHTVVTDKAVEATCTETGLTEGSHCEVCGEVLVAQEVVAALGHTVVTDKAVEATCTETGLTEGSHCEVCGEVLTKQEVVAALGHTVVTDKAVEATCTETGLTEGSHCEVCGEVLVKQEVVAALGHEYKADVVTWAEDYSTAVITLVCTHDASHKVEVDASSVENTVKDKEVTYTATVEYGGNTYTATVTANLPDETVNPFKDVKESDYYYDAVMWAVDQNITSGITADTFGSGQSCTRSQMVTFLWKAAGCPEPKTTVNPFVDINSKKHYYKAVLWAVENEITVGVDDTHFKPELTIDRKQAVTFLWSAAGKPNASITDVSFTDVPKSAYYYQAVLWAVENNITLGYPDNTFGPTRPCTRSQVVAFLYRGKDLL